MRSVYLIIICVLLIAGKSFPQQLPSVISEKSFSRNADYTVEVWTSENGLPQNSIIDIAQTNDGYLWIATFGGLVKFDGIRFKIFNAGNTISFPSNVFTQLMVDSKGVLWMISDNGALLKYANGIFETVYFINRKKHPITAITESEMGRLWLAGADGNIYYLKDKQLILQYSIPDRTINALKFGINNELFAGTDSGLYKCANAVVREIPETKDLLIKDITGYFSNTLWITTPSEIFNISNNTICNIYPLPKEIRDKGIVINHVFVDKTNKVYISTENGLFITDQNKEKKYDTELGLSAVNIRMTYEDKEGNLWVGTHNGGLNKMKPKLFTSFSKENGLIEDGVAPVMQAKDGSIYIGNNCGGLNILKDGKFQHIIKGFSNTCIWSLMEDEEGSIWVGTYGGGLSKIKGNKIFNYTTEDGLSSNIILSIFQDTEGSVWIGTETGLCKYSEAHIRRVDYTPVNNKPITFITEDNKGRIWFCFNAGIGMIDNGIVTLYGNQDGLPAENVRCMYEDTDGAMWLGTNGGSLIRFKSGTFFSFAKLENVLDKNVWCIVEDDAGYFWMSGNNGIYRVSRTALNNYADGKSDVVNAQHFGKEDGIVNTEFNGGFQPSVMKASDGKLWFPGVKGVVVVNPKDIIRHDFYPVIEIEKVFVNGREYLMDNGKLQLNSTPQILEFEYTTPSFSNSSNILFQYRLDGYDQDWSMPTPNRTAKYIGITEGEYTFRVRLYGNVSLSGREAKISFTAPLPYYRTKSFVLYVSAAVLAVIALIMFGRIRLVRKQEQEKAEIINRYSVLELRALQSQMNPHFIFNCLNTIKYFITTKDETAAAKYLGKFSSLMRMFLEHSKSNTVSLREEIDLLKLYVDLEQLRFENGFNFNLEIDTNLDLDNIDIPGMLFQPFVENAIEHGLRNLERKGTLRLSFVSGIDELVGTIEDDGVGREKAIAYKQEYGSPYESRGIQITDERVKLINYMRHLKMGIYIFDKKSEAGEPEGTRVTVKIPLSKN